MSCMSDNTMVRAAGSLDKHSLCFRNLAYIWDTSRAITGSVRITIPFLCKMKQSEYRQHGNAGI